MFIEIDIDRIVLSQHKNALKRYQISQLDFFGYKLVEDNYILKTSSLNKELTRIIDYLNIEGVKFKMSIEANNFFLRIIESNNHKESLSKIGKSIKNGNFNKDEFNTFNEFLNTLPRNLREHQRKASFHLYSLKNGANFSVPGSGKTSVVISVYEKFRRENKCNIMFVVGPPSSFQPWQNEFQSTLGRAVKTTILSGGDKYMRYEEYYTKKGLISELYLSTFQTVMNDYDKIIHLISQNGVKAYLVIDEAHYMKQIGGTWANSILKISSHAKFKCILTGTPIPKSYKDIFNLFDFLWSDISPLSEEDRIKIVSLEKSNNAKDIKKILDNKIGGLFYRVRKKDLGLKPANFHDPIKLNMKTNEERIYSLIKSRIKELSQGDYINNLEVLEKLWRGRMMRLRQCVSYPKLLLKGIDNYDENLLNTELLSLIKNYDRDEVPEKLDYLTKKVKEFNNKNLKVLIWSNFIGTLELIKKHFLSINLNCELIYGKTPIKSDSRITRSKEATREEIRDMFVKPNSGLDILIANPAACAESISLHKTCFHAFYYDLSYNCAQYLQSLDRIHRVGGSENNIANYYFLQYNGSIDEDIKKNLELKAQRMYDIIETDYEIYNLNMFDGQIEDDIEAYKRIFK